MDFNQIQFRKAKKEDVIDIVRLYSEDELGVKREAYSNPLPKNYYIAFEEINADVNNELIVLEYESHIIGTFQLTFIPHLVLQGTKRAQIEGVRIDKKFRNQGLGSKMMEWIFNRAKDKGCSLIQLTTNKDRKDAIRFYEKLEFKATHEGMKIVI